MVVEKISYEPEKIMKVFIGKYPQWWGPYQIADLIQKVGLSEDRCDKLGDWFADTPIYTFCNWVDSKRKRKIQVRIDKYDTWNMESTLSYIIIPMLKQLKETKHGSPNVDDTDMPKELRSTSAPEKENEWDIDDNWHDRWNWVLDEMIWAFEKIGKVPEEKDLEAQDKRMQNGFRLFGKYYQNLWD